MTTTDLAVNVASNLALPMNVESALETHAEAKDLIIPKLLVMQGLSQAVSDGKAVLGEIRDSLDNKLFGAKEKTLEFIPLHFYKTWILFEEEKGKLEYKAQVPYTPANANWEWETIVDGKKVRRDQAINVYCVLPSEIKEGIFLPYIVSFRRTSYVTGKKLLTDREKMLIAKRKWHTKTFKLGSKQEKNDMGSYYIFTTEMGRDTKPEEIEAITPWLAMVTSQSLKVDDSDLVNENKTPTNGGSSSAFEYNSSEELPF